MWLTSFGGIVSVFTRFAGYQHHLLPFWYFPFASLPVAVFLSVSPSCPSPPVSHLRLQLQLSVRLCSCSSFCTVPLPRFVAVVAFVARLWLCCCYCCFLFVVFFLSAAWAAILLLDFCGLSARSHIKIDWIPVKLISQVNAVAQSLLRHPHSPDIPTPASLDCSSAEAVVNYAPRLVFYIKRQTPAPEIATVYWPGQAWKLQAGSYKLKSAGAGCCSPALLALPGSVKIFDHLGSHGIYFALAWHISAAFY